MEQWLEQTWWLLGIIAALAGYITLINTGFGQIGIYLRSKLLGKWQSDMLEFMESHANCKANTEKELSNINKKLDDITNSINDINKILPKDLRSINLSFQIFDAILMHIKYGNHDKQIDKAMEDLHQHLIDRGLQ